MEEKEYEVIKLEDGLEYAIVYQINPYVYLANINNPKDVLIRKMVEEKNGDIYFEGLDSDSEFDKALLMFLKENPKI